MTINPLYRRRVERFAQLIDEVEGGRRHHVRSDLDGDLGPLVTLTRQVSAVPVSIAPDTEFRVGLRAMLMARIEREGIGETALPVVDPSPLPPPRTAPGHAGSSVFPRLLAGANGRPGRLRAVDPIGLVAAGYQTPTVATVSPRTRRNRARAAALIGVTIGALALSGVSGASDDAVPGDPLYKIKRSSEKAQLALASSNVSRGRLLLGFARIRLYEAQRVAPELAHDALVDMRQEARDGLKALATAAVDHRDAAALRAVDDFVAWARPQILQLIATLPADHQQDALDALRDLDAVATRSADLRDTAACGASDNMDEYGPLPQTCPAAETDRQRQRATPTAVGGGAAATVAAPVTGPAGHPSAGPASGGPSGADHATIPPGPPTTPPGQAKKSKGTN